MQAQIDDVIELLEDYCKWCNAQGGQCQLNLDGCAVGEALAKLKEEPEQGEFTKNIMANLGGAYRDTIVVWLKEVCRRYDWLVKRNAELHIESHEKDRTITQLRRQKTSIISQLNQQIDQLQAEKERYKRGALQTVADSNNLQLQASKEIRHLRAENKDYRRFLKEENRG